MKKKTNNISFSNLFNQNNISVESLGHKVIHIGREHSFKCTEWTKFKVLNLPT